MVDSLYENEIDFGDFINDCDNICEVILLFLEFEFFVVIFNNVFECYLFDRDIECWYMIKILVKLYFRDWIGLFKVGW